MFCSEIGPAAQIAEDRLEAVRKAVEHGPYSAAIPAAGAAARIRPRPSQRGQVPTSPVSGIPMRPMPAAERADIVGTSNRRIRREPDALGRWGTISRFCRPARQDRRRCRSRFRTDPLDARLAGIGAGPSPPPSGMSIQRPSFSAKALGGCHRRPTARTRCIQWYWRTKATSTNITISDGHRRSCWPRAACGTCGGSPSCPACATTRRARPAKSDFRVSRLERGCLTQNLPDGRRLIVADFHHQPSRSALNTGGLRKQAAKSSAGRPGRRPARGAARSRAPCGRRPHSAVAT
jgi:hypothetical protein